MNTSVYFTIFSFFGSLFLLLNFKKIKGDIRQATKLYKIMIWINFAAILTEFGCYICFYKLGVFSTRTLIATRIFLVLLATWVSVFTMYIATVSFYPNQKLIKKISLFLKCVYAVFLILVLALPVYFNAKMAYASGPATNVIFYFSEFYIALAFVFMFKNSKKIEIKKYSPLFIYIAGGIMLMVLQSAHPQWLLANFVDIVVNLLMYFTLETSKKAPNKRKKVNK